MEKSKVYDIRFQRYKDKKRNWVYATNSHFSTPISLQPDDVNLWYFKLRLFDLTELIVWNIKGLGKRVAKLQELESEFVAKLNFFGLLAKTQLYYWIIIT